MSDVIIELPRYQCHKQVWALKIKLVIPNPRGVELHFENERYCPFEMTEEWAIRHQPHPGGYLVVYEDGYRSYSPGREFENGYTLLDGSTSANAASTSPSIDPQPMRLTADNRDALLKLKEHFDHVPGMPIIPAPAEQGALSKIVAAEVVKAQPGDLVVFRAKTGGFSADELGGMLTHLKAMLPDGVKGCVVVGDVEISSLSEEQLRLSGLLKVDNQAAVSVLAERRRQVEVEGWTPEHDDLHEGGQISRAAVSYALSYGVTMDPACWPWDKSWWKPKDYRTNLVKAGALILAEIERLDRAQAKSVEAV